LGAISIAVASLIAYMSWNPIEKPMLNFGRRLA
jgi:hypothetical protein